MMMMTGFSAIPQSTTTVLRAMPRKTSVDEAEAVGEKEEITEPKTTNTTNANTPAPATSKNIALPVGLGAGGALAGGIAAGQGFWEYAPNTGTMSEADALAKVKEDSTLKTAAEKELASLKDKKIDKFLDDQDEVAKKLNQPIKSAAGRKQYKEEIFSKPEELKIYRESGFKALKSIEIISEGMKDFTALTKENDYFDEVATLIEAETDFAKKNLLQNQLQDYKNTLESEISLQGELFEAKMTLLEATDEADKLTIQQVLVQTRTAITQTQQAKILPQELKTFEQAQIQAGKLIAIDKNTALEQKAKEALNQQMAGFFRDQGFSIDSLDIMNTSLKKSLSDIEAYEKLDLKDTPSVQKLTKASLKTATQKVEGFMKWGYAKAEDLKSIGGEELVKHANSSKIALGAGALVAGAGAGTLAYFLLNKPKSTTAKPSEE